MINKNLLCFILKLNIHIIIASQTQNNSLYFLNKFTSTKTSKLNTITNPEKLAFLKPNSPPSASSAQYSSHHQPPAHKLQKVSLIYEEPPPPPIRTPLFKQPSNQHDANSSSSICKSFSLNSIQTKQMAPSQGSNALNEKKRKLQNSNRLKK